MSEETLVSSSGNGNVVRDGGGDAVSTASKNSSSNNYNSPATTFKVVHEHTPKKHNALWKFCIPTVLAICIAAMLATVEDVQVLQQGWLWITGGAVLALLVFETAQHAGVGRASSKTELVVTVCPLGVQRSVNTITTRSGSNADKMRRQQHHHPLLLTECIQDCIVLEHVGAFSVTTHVMFRVLCKREARKNDIRLVPAFPNARLSFDQCLSLKNRIQASLQEIQ